MGGALGGFALIAVVIGSGWLIAHLRIVDRRGQALLSDVAFRVASPPLLFLLVARGDIHRVFSLPLVVTVAAVAVVVVLHLLLVARSRMGAGERAMSSMAVAYTNSANLGLPITASVLGDMTWVAPLILFQVVVFQPVVLAILDVQAARRARRRTSRWRFAVMPLRNPLTVGIVLGLLVNLFDVSVPTLVEQPAEMVGAMAVPMMLMAFGASLRLEPLPGRDAPPGLWRSVVLKLLVHPVVAFLIGWPVGLTDHELLAVTVLAGLPTAQMTFIVSARYDVAARLCRDNVFWTTIGSVATITVIASLLG